MAACALAAASVLLAGCSKSKSSPTAPQASTPPTPDSPTAAVLLLKWVWANRSAENYATLLTSDYVFQFGLGDSAAQAFPDGLTRAQELAAAQALFAAGVPGHSPARSVSLTMDTNLHAIPDSRPGKTAGWHQEVDSQYDLGVDFGSTSFQSSGQVRFFLVRGDSANLPPAAVEATAAGDSTRWYLERWEEQTPLTPSGVTHPQPTRSLTWGDLKAEYLGWSPTASRATDSGGRRTE